VENSGQEEEAQVGNSQTSGGSNGGTVDEVQSGPLILK
jgi:hypothetical protein